MSYSASEVIITTLRASVNATKATFLMYSVVVRLFGSLSTSLSVSFLRNRVTASLEARKALLAGIALET